MKFRRDRRSVPLLNTASVADISFMLLILFLVVTSMDVDKGLSRLLPPPQPTEQLPAVRVSEDMMMHLTITADNHVTVNDQPIRIEQLTEKVVQFVAQPGMAQKHVIQIECDAQAAYDTYFKVQNQIVSAYRKLRDTEARRRFHTTYASCNEEQKATLQQAFPQRVSEVYAAKEGGER